MDAVERRQKLPQELAKTAKEDVDEILKQLEREGRFEERKALLKEINQTNGELAELEVRLMDHGVLLSGIVVGVLIMITARKALEHYFIE